MPWELFFAGVGAACALLTVFAIVVKLLISSELRGAMLTIAQSYVTKDEFDKHIEHCPNAQRNQH